MKHESKKLPSIQRMAFGDYQNIVPLTHEAGQYLEVARNANRAWDAIQSVHERRMADQTIAPFARLVQSADHATGAIGAVKASHERAQVSGLREMERLDNIVRDALRPPAHAGHAQVDAEIRQWARTAKAEELVGELNKEHPDPDLVRALATAPARLSGLAEPLAKKARSLHLSNVIPEDYARAQNLHAAAEAARTAVETLTTWSNGLIDFGSVDAHKKAQSAA